MFYGKIKGIKAAMYSLNKSDQSKEYDFLQHIAWDRKIEINLPDPSSIKISVKKWDSEYLEPAAIKIFGSMEKYWVEMKKDFWCINEQEQDVRCPGECLHCSKIT